MFETGPNWRRDAALGAVLIAVMIAIPLLGPSRYLIGQLTLFFIWATVVSQWNLVFGVAGIFSLAQMAIFAFGGFATGMIGLYLDISLWAALPLAGIGAILFSLLIGLACLRLRGPYVALLTLAIAQVMYLLIITDTACFYMEGVTCRNFTGGTRGLSKFGDFGFREMLGRREYLKGDYYLSALPAHDRDDLLLRPHPQPPRLRLSGASRQPGIRHLPRAQPLQVSAPRVRHDGLRSPGSRAASSPGISASWAPMSSICRCCSS